MLLIVLAAGAALRLYGLHSLPPGLYQDEAFNGLDALDVIDGARPLYFPANNGREPFFIYLVALSVSILGRTPFAVRLPAALVGILTIPATYALGRALFGKRVGLWAAILIAITFWPVALSRVGFRAGTLPLFFALGLACAAAGWRRRRPWQVALGGLFYGFTFYTYLAARFTPLVLGAFLIFWYIARRHSFPPGRWLAAFGLAAAIVIAPLAATALWNPEILSGRAGQVSILNPAINRGDLWGTLFDNLVRAAGMFVWRGDDIARHNLPGRPVFDPLLGAAFLAGVVIAAWRLWARRDLASALALAWLGVMLLPTALAEDTPHFLRAVGVMPAICLFPALALEAIEVAARGRQIPGAGRMLAVLAVLLSAGLTLRDYFWRYARSPDTAYLFQSAAAELAGGVNDYLAGGRGRQVYLDRRFWDTFPSVRFLVPATGRLTLFTEDALPQAGLAAPEGVRVIVWPYADPLPVLRLLPPGALLRPEAGPLHRGDLEPGPYALFATYTASPCSLPACAGIVAEFEGGFRLLGYSAHRAPAGPVLDLVWAAERAPEKDVQVFAQAIASGGELVAQADGPLGTALYPSRWWRAGEIVQESRSFSLPPGVTSAGLVIDLGLYDPVTGRRLQRTDESGDRVRIVP